MAKAFGIITSSADKKVAGLQNYRSIGAFSFLGRYRVIDFPISNFSNSNINNIQVYIASMPRSMVEHIGTGRHYNINSKRGKIQILFPDQTMANEVYNTNIKSFRRNIEQIKKMEKEYVVIAPSCMIFAQDFDALLQDHAESGSDITMLYHKVTDAKKGYSTCNVLDLDGNRVKGISACLSDKDEENIFMESYVMKTELLYDLMDRAAAISSIYSLSDIVNAELKSLDVRAVEHKGFFAPITSLRTYLKANLDLINPENSDDLFKKDWPIYTRTTDACPTQYYPTVSVKNSLISNGCIIKGTVENSVIGRGAVIEEGAVVKNCVISAYDKIGKGAVLENQVVDKYATIQDGTKVVAPETTPGYIKYRDRL